MRLDFTIITKSLIPFRTLFAIALSTEHTLLLNMAPTVQLSILGTLVQ